jgi:hypothetical protein
MPFTDIDPGNYLQYVSSSSGESEIGAYKNRTLPIETRAIQLTWYIGYLPTRHVKGARVKAYQNSL